MRHAARHQIYGMLRPAKTRTKAIRTRNNASWLMILPAVTVLAVVGVIPLLAVLNHSFFDIFTIKDRYWVGLEWYAELLQTPDFYLALGRSLLFTTLVVLIQFPLGIGIALLIPKGTRLGTACLMLLAVPLVVPWNMIPILWLSLLNPDYGALTLAMDQVGIAFDHKNNALHAWILILLVDTWHWVGLVAILAYSGLITIPPSYYQAARIDGARRRDVLLYIQLPKLAGVMMMALLLRFMDSLMIYTEVFAINAGGPDGATSFLSLELGEEIKAFDYGPAAARSVVYFLIVLSVAWGFQAVYRHGQGGDRE